MTLFENMTFLSLYMTLEFEFFRFPNGFDNDDEGIHASLLRYLQAELGMFLANSKKTDIINFILKNQVIFFLRSIYGSRLVRP